MPFISEKELLVSSYAEKNIEPHSGTSGFTICSEETEKEDVTGGFCFVKISPELSFLSPSELVVEGGKDTSEQKLLELDKKDGNNVAVNSEEVLLSMSLDNTAEPDYGTEGFSLHPQDSNMMEVPAVTNIFSATPESNHPASLDSNDAQTCDAHLPEQEGQEDFLDPLVVDSFEDSFATSEFLSRSAGAEMTEVLGGVKEGLSEGASNHQNDVVSPSADGGDAENALSYSVSVELIPEPNIMEALQNEVNMTEILRGGTFPAQENHNDFSFDERTSMIIPNVKPAENYTDYARSSELIPEINMIETLNIGKEATAPLEHEVSSNYDISLKAPDVGNGVEKFDNWSFGPVVDASESLQAAQGFSNVQSENDFAFGFQGPERAIVSISQYEVDSLEKNGSDSICADEATMNGDIQGISKSPSQSQVELPGAYVTTDKVNHPEHSRSSSSVLDDNLIELAAGKERSFDPKDENPSNFQETSPYESLSNNLMCASASHTSKKDSVTFSVKGFPDPSLEDVNSFDKISGDEQVNKSPKENALGCEHIVRTQAEVNSIESQGFTETSNCNCTQASESVNEGFFEQEHQGPELVLSQVGMTFFMDEGEETEKCLGSSSTACALETLQVLPVSLRQVKCVSCVAQIIRNQKTLKLMIWKRAFKT
ncbi:uncharacterized protein LOC120647016 isoform X3 [Panicum virgatum]|uniref:uncharacterized protein LOC120647016 isoform X3 n=1 Tax=Panicum virgatum TaxID=38727 RepID=UPI0019D53E25|nr:uncharacterized protein LOC120647016 isoform X3 [Panicum virgatum]XP_039779574.1 uncharacterized protein LOC120647016 isoform X3 [Panicum virgatum]